MSAGVSGSEKVLPSWNLCSSWKEMVVTTPYHDEGSGAYKKGVSSSKHQKSITPCGHVCKIKEVREPKAERHLHRSFSLWASQVALVVKNLPAVQET